MGTSCQAPGPRLGLGAPRGEHGLAGAAIVLGHGASPGVPQPGGKRGWGLGVTQGAGFAGPGQH